ncbi:helix-turn-helix transcriptional regulator [Chitinolyticbacter meiyuanensis]|uniref:helix-turn-helix transcriptional regulator n=1 Tax=Chitinolyticbacter meiyuanensis TaxID=682798 RepID=UPI0011E59DE7|nr:WYL domain-containing protein [Chitinolyticbacter meiyuanensis]
MLTATNRLLRLLSLLQTRRHWAGNELAERLEVHPRTLRRDIDKLRELGYPIHASSGVAGGYAFRAGQALPPLLLDDDEALATALALQLATSGPIDGVEEPSLRALVKLEQVMPPRLRSRVKALRSAIVPMGQTEAGVEAALLATLASACRDQLQLRFDYADGRGQTSVRIVEPQGVVHTGRRWYLVAWDPARDDWRTFRVDRIQGGAELGRHFAPRAAPEGDLRAYVTRSVAVAPFEARARVVLHAPHAEMVRRIPPSAALLEPLENGHCLMQCGIHALDHLVYWLLALEVEFDVQSPPLLIERLQLATERVVRAVTRLQDKPK